MLIRQAEEQHAVQSDIRHDIADRSGNKRGEQRGPRQSEPNGMAAKRGHHRWRLPGRRSAVSSR